MPQDVPVFHVWNVHCMKSGLYRKVFKPRRKPLASFYISYYIYYDLIDIRKSHAGTGTELLTWGKQVQGSWRLNYVRSWPLFDAHSYDLSTDARKDQAASICNAWMHLELLAPDIMP